MEEKVEALCEMCSSAKAREFCRQCAEFICEDCARSHRKMRVKYPDHQVVTLAELKQGGARNLPLNAAPPTKCSDHDEELKLFCFDCNRLICRDCIVIEHADHRYEFVRKTASKCRQALSENLGPLREFGECVSVATRQIEGIKSSVSSQGAYVTEYIEQRFDELFEILQQRKQELLYKATRLAQKKLETLSNQQKTLDVATAEVQGLVEFVERNLEIVSDEEILSIHQHLLTQIKQECKKWGEKDLIPSDVANIAVSITCTEDIARTCQNKSRVYLFPAQKWPQVHTAEVGKGTTQFIIDPNDTSHKPMQCPEAELKSLVDGSTIQAQVIKTGKGLYEVTYQPKVRGRHELCVHVNGKLISGSPFPVFAKMPPSLLGKPVSVVDGLRHPYSAVFDANQNLLVTESGGHKIRMFKKMKGKMEVEDFIEHQVSNPTGLSLDKAGNIYVANVSSHSISKYGRNGKCLKVVGREGNQRGEFSHPSGIAVIGKEVFVCDRKNSRIQVFDSQLNFTRSFGLHGSENGELHWPYDLVQDQTGHIYITDGDNHRIQIFDSGGHFVHVFGSQGSAKGMVKRPTGICIGADQLIYITEYANHRVSVFQTTGEFVASFCKYGSEKGDLCYPVGVTVDEDGFVYVCDQGNNRIQVF